MNTEKHQIHVGGLTVDVVRKAIKNLHLGVYPPDGRVRVAVPLAVSDEAVRLAVIGKLGWIKRQRKGFQGQVRQSERQMVSGESHYFLGRRFRLRVTEHAGPARVIVRSTRFIDVRVRPGASGDDREKVLHRWYRAQLKALIPPLLEKWQPVLGVQAADWGIKRMKTNGGVATSVLAASGSTWSWPRNRCGVWSTSRSTSWFTCWSGTTMIDSPRSWTGSCHSGGCTGMS